MARILRHYNLNLQLGDDIFMGLLSEEENQNGMNWLSTRPLKVTEY